MKSITIFTPTYNRAYTLPKLYSSLCSQSSQDFVWSIVDDGSTDNTEELVRGWIEERNVDIIYEKQPNGGKMRAHNKGVQKCDTELFLCVDSDDYLTDNAVESILDEWQSHSENSLVGGIVAYKAIPKDGVSSIPVRFNRVGTSTLHNLYATGFDGDTTLVFRTSVIREFPFPEIEGEKFITEGYSYDQIDTKYEYALLDEALTMCEYMPDGYTRGITKIYLNNPKGYALYYNQSLKLFPPTSIKAKIKQVALYIMCSRMAKNKNVYRDLNFKSYLLPLSWFASFYFYFKLINNKTF